MTKYIDKSERITAGVRKSFQSADCKMANRSCYGYDTTSSGELIFNDVEAKVVSWILKCYLSGDSLGKIAVGLQNQNIPFPSGKSYGTAKRFPNFFRMRNTPDLYCFRRH